MAASDFEILATNFLNVLQHSRYRIDQFGYADEGNRDILSRMYGTYIVWLTSHEEARVHERSKSPQASFTKHVIRELPEINPPSATGRPGPESIGTLRQRAEALWGVRVAMTYGDGDIELISDPTDKQYAYDAVNFLPESRLMAAK